MNSHSIIRLGMWVAHKDGVAVVAAIAPGGAEIHFTDNRGQTVGSRIASLAELRQAKLSDIPSARRPTAARGAALGYN